MLTKNEFYEQLHVLFNERAIKQYGFIIVRVDPETLDLRGEYDIIPIFPPFNFRLVKFDETAYDEYKKVCEKIKKMKYVGYADDAIVYGETKEKVIEKLKELSGSVDESEINDIISMWLEP